MIEFFDQRERDLAQRQPAVAIGGPLHGKFPDSVIEFERPQNYFYVKHETVRLTFLIEPAGYKSFIYLKTTLGICERIWKSHDGNHDPAEEKCAHAPGEPMR